VKKIRILVSTLLISTMLLSLVGCGDKKENDGSDKGNKSQTEQKSDDNKKEEKKSSYKKDPDLDQTLGVGKGAVTFAIDVPTGWGSGGVGTGWGCTDLKRGLYVICDTYLNGTSEDDYEVDLDSIKSADQVIEGMAKQFVVTGMGYLPFSMKREYEIIKKENVSINGWDMCRYEGKFILDDDPIIQIKDKKAYFVAYTVIKDGFPIYFAVVDESDAQEQSAIVAELADKIAKTFRRYEDK
jgi:hypothetical protein